MKAAVNSSNSSATIAFYSFVCFNRVTTHDDNDDDKEIDEQGKREEKRGRTFFYVYNGTTREGEDRGDI